jgi:CSLREA domain-containing protein
MRRALLAAALAALAMAAPASAADFVVTTTADGPTCDASSCTLRGALTMAGQNGTQAQDTITVPASPTPYTVQTGAALNISPNVVLFGAGADTTRIEETSKKSRTLLVSGSGPQAQIRNLTIAGGTAAANPNAGFGGNILVSGGANLLLDHVRVTGGTAQRGGGIAIVGGAVVDIRHSLIDNNQATGNADVTGDGGGILVAPLAGATSTPVTLGVSDSTIAFNSAGTSTSPGGGAGITARADTANTTTLTRVTLSDNTASTWPGGIWVADAESFKVSASIVARNVSQNLGQRVVNPPNCRGALTNGGATIESGSECGFTLKGSTAGLEPALRMDGGMTPVLPIPADSVARDFAGACTGTDQRDVTRPQGAACDAGAYE